MPIAPGIEKQEALVSAGFTGEEIAQWQSDTQAELSNAGFSTKEIDDYFGRKEPNLDGLKSKFSENLKAVTPKEPAKEGEVLPPETISPEAQRKKEAQSFLEAMEAGWQMSVEGLIDRGKLPDLVLPENAPMYYNIASAIGTIKGDIPDMVAGAIAGAGIGSFAGPIGTVAGAGAGSAALPEFVRQSLIEAYEKGEVTSFGDFWERASSVFIETSKQGVIGGLTAGAGGVVGRAIAPTVLSPAQKVLTRTSTEIATMTSVGAALEGRIPEPEEFIEAGVLVGGMHVAVGTATKLRNVYKDTGIRPADIVEQSAKDPTIKQDLAAVNREVPSALKENLSPDRQKPIKLENQKPSERIPETKAEPIPLDSAQEKVLSRIGDPNEVKGKPYTTKDFYKDFVDKLDPINEATKVLEKQSGKVSVDQNPYVLSRMVNDSKAKAKHAVERGTLDFKSLEINGEGLKQILDPIMKDKNAFEAYLLSKRAIEVSGRGIKTGVDLESAQAVVKGGKRFEAQAKKLVDYQNRMLAYLRDSGILTKESYGAMVEAGKDFIPLKRLIDPEDSSVSGGKGGKGTVGKALVGSEAKVQSPLLTVVENTETIFRLAEKNRATQSLVELAERTKDQKLIERTSQSKPITVSKEELSRALKVSPDDVEAFNIYRNKNRPLAKNEFEVYRDGKREVWRSSDENLAQSIKSLDGDEASTNVLFKLARGITGVKRFGIAITPDFISKNIFRDQLTAGVFSESGTLSFIDMVHAAGDLIKKNDTYYNWLKSGGGQGTFLDLNERYLKQDIFKLNEQTGFRDAAFNVVKKPFEALRVAAELGEKATRLAEFKRVSKGASSGERLVKGGFSSREITVDFQRVGAKMSALNSITAFQNVSIQGLDRTIRAIKYDPKGVFMRAGALITTPSILLWWANKEDQRVQSLPRWQKDMFWIVPTDDWQDPKEGEDLSLLPEYLKRTVNGKTQVNKGTIYRLPKPQELGILFGSVPERLLDQFFTDNPSALKDFEETMINLTTPSMVPDAVSPVIEQYFNKSLFTGNPIIPGYLEGQLSAYQYTEYSSEAAKQLGKLIAQIPGMDNPGTLASPQVIDNYIRSWSGSLGVYANQLADELLVKAGLTPDPVKPDRTLSDIPFIKAFTVRFPSGGLQPIQDFREVNRRTEAIFKTIRSLAKENNPEALDVFDQYQEEFVRLSGINQALNQMGSMIRKVYKNPELSSSDKRQMIDGLYYGMLETAKAGLEVYTQALKPIVEDKKNDSIGQ